MNELESRRETASHSGWALWRGAVVALVFFTILTGVVYPAAITLLAQAVWPGQSGGSLVTQDGRVIGSELLGQAFSSPVYLWPRPSATSAPYDAGSSSGSNLAASNPAWQERVAARRAAWLASDPTNSEPIPVDLLTASGSGLDPHVSPAGARWQVRRIAAARGIPEAQVLEVIDRSTESSFLGLFGAVRVNVLKVNQELDRVTRQDTRR